MGLFDKKKRGGKDEFDSPVEQISLSAADAGVSGSGEDSAPEPTLAHASAANDAPGAQAANGRTAPEKSVAGGRRNGAASGPVDTGGGGEYGINRAIELMRLLPGDNIELVVQVVKKTLESTNVKIAEIIEDGARKQKTIENRIEVLKAEISELEAEIATRRDEISTLQTDYEETTEVKERLVLAEKMSEAQAGSSGPPKAPPKNAKDAKDASKLSDAAAQDT